MRYALLWTSPTCVVEGCTRTIVEHDHCFGAEYKDTRHTRLHELDRLCHTHHDLRTYHGWALVAGSGKRPMVPPDDPAHPGQAGAGPRAGPEPPELRSRGAGSAQRAEADLTMAIDEALARRARAVHERIQRRPAGPSHLGTNRTAQAS